MHSKHANTLLKLWPILITFDYNREKYEISGVWASDGRFPLVGPSAYETDGNGGGRRQCSAAKPFLDGRVAKRRGRRAACLEAATVMRLTVRRLTVSSDRRHRRGDGDDDRGKTSRRRRGIRMDFVDVSFLPNRVADLNDV